MSKKKETMPEPDTVESLYKANYQNEIDYALNHLANAERWLKKMGLPKCAKEINDAWGRTCMIKILIDHGDAHLIEDKEAKE